MPTVAEVLKDPNFQAMDPAEKHKVLARLDTRFAMLDPEEQAKITGAKKTQPSLLEKGIGAGVRYGKGVFRTTVAPMVDLAGEVVKRGGPIAAAPSMYRDMFKGAQQASQGEFEKGFAAPTLPEKAGHFAAGALPMVGPAAAAEGERIGSGDIAGGLGGMVGLLSQMFLGEGLRSPKAARPTSAPMMPKEAPSAPRPVSPVTVPEAPVAAPAAEGVTRRAFLGKTAGAVAGAATRPPSVAPSVPATAPPARIPKFLLEQAESGRAHMEQLLDDADYVRENGEDALRNYFYDVEGSEADIDAFKQLAKEAPEALSEGSLDILNKFDGLMGDIFNFGKGTAETLTGPIDAPAPPSSMKDLITERQPPSAIEQAKVPPQVHPRRGPDPTRTPSAKFDPANLPPQFKGEFDARGTAMYEKGFGKGPGPRRPQVPGEENIDLSSLDQQEGPGYGLNDEHVLDRIRAGEDVEYPEEFPSHPGRPTSADQLFDPNRGPEQLYDRQHGEGAFNADRFGSDAPKALEDKHKTIKVMELEGNPMEDGDFVIDLGGGYRLRPSQTSRYGPEIVAPNGKVYPADNLPLEAKVGMKARIPWVRDVDNLQVDDIIADATSAHLKAQGYSMDQINSLLDGEYDYSHGKMLKWDDEAQGVVEVKPARAQQALAAKRQELAGKSERAITDHLNPLSDMDALVAKNRKYSVDQAAQLLDTVPGGQNLTLRQIIAGRVKAGESLPEVVDDMFSEPSQTKQRFDNILDTGKGEEFKSNIKPQRDWSTMHPTKGKNALPLSQPPKAEAVVWPGKIPVPVMRAHNMVAAAFDKIKNRAAALLNEPDLRKMKFRLVKGEHPNFKGKRAMFGDVRRTDTIDWDPSEVAFMSSSPREFADHVIDMLLHEPAHTRGLHDFPVPGYDPSGDFPLRNEPGFGEVPHPVLPIHGGEKGAIIPEEWFGHSKENIYNRAKVSTEEGRFVVGEDILNHDPEILKTVTQLRKQLETSGLWEEAKKYGDPLAAIKQFLGIQKPTGLHGGGAPASPPKPPSTGAAGAAPGAAKLPEVPLTLAEKSGSPSAALAERALETSAPGAKTFRKFRAQQQEALQGMSKAVVEDISKFKGSPEELGAEWQKSTKTALEGLKSEAAEAYSQVDDMAEGVKPSTALPKAFAKSVLKDMKAESKLVPPKELERLRDIVTRVSKSPDRVSFRAMADARSTLLTIARERGVGALAGKAGGTIKKLVQTMDQAMEDAAKTKPGLLEKFREVNSAWRDIHDTFDRSVVSKMMDAAPEKVHTYLKGASLEDIDRLAKVTPPETWDAIRGKVVESIFDTATEGESGSWFSRLTGQGSAGPKMRPKKLRSILEDQYGHDKLQRIFKDRPDALQNVFKVLDTADKVGHSSSSFLGAFINARVMWKTGNAIFSGDPGGLVEPALIMLTGKTAAKLMTKAWGANVMKNYLEATKTAKGTAKAQFWMSRMNEAMDKEEKKEGKDPWRGVAAKAGFKAGMEEKK